MPSRQGPHAHEVGIFLPGDAITVWGFSGVSNVIIPSHSMMAEQGAANDVPCRTPDGEVRWVPREDVKLASS